MVKKGILFLFIIGVVTMVFVLLPTESEEIRIRILANSNSVYDIKEKEIVKEELEKILNEIDELDIDVIESKLKNRLKNVITNSINVSYVNSYYPAKSYDGKFIPSGTYKTILVTLGNGTGSNFWTLLYPKYYNIEFEEKNEIEYRVYIWDLFRKFLRN